MMAENYGKIDGQSQKKSRKRLIIIGVSSLLLVVAIISVAVGVTVSNKNNNKAEDSQPANGDTADLATGSKAIAAACNSTTEPETCNEELGKNQKSLKANPRELVSIAVEITLSHVQNSFYLATNLSLQSGGLTESLALENCADLMDNSKEYLDQAIARLGNLSLTELSSELYDVLVWLSTVGSYEDACANGFDDLPTTEAGPRSEAMKNDQVGLKKVIVVALDLVNSLTNLGDNLASWKSSFHLRRRLLSMGDQGENEVDQDGFPRWVGAAERKLLASPSSRIIADAVVGAGGYRSIQQAVNNIPKNRKKRWVIYIKAGVYKEYVTVPKEQKDVTFIGDGMGRTIITGNRNVALQGYTTFNTPTVAFAAQGFIARGISFRNTAGAIAHQAVAVRASADYTVFYQCNFEGYQDTLYAHAGRQFYRDCDIYGTVDYIFGNAIAVFQNSRLLARRPLKGQKNTYTAHGRSTANDPSGYSFQSCSVVAAPELASTPYAVYSYYGRPWRAYSRVVFISCFVDKVLHPDGWLPWDPSNPFTNTLYYGEHRNTGPGAGIAGRVKWKGVHSAMSPAKASGFSVSRFIGPVGWIRSAGVPFS